MEGSLKYDVYTVVMHRKIFMEGMKGMIMATCGGRDET